MTYSGDTRSPKSNMTRRAFLKTSTGVISLTVMGLPTIGRAQVPGGTGIPGVATQRIEGRSKVTGAKVFAHDYNSRDLTDQGWPKTQWHAMFLRALTTTKAFKDVNRDNLQRDANPTRIVLGDDLTKEQRSPALSLGRDCIVDEQLFQITCGE